MPVLRYDVDLASVYCKINDDEFMPIQCYDDELTSICRKTNAVSLMVA